ncbi:hypothetical protein Tco_1108213 [Tanacetum coccineum]
MTSTKASISKASKRPKINIIPPKQLFVDLTQDDTKTPSPKLQLSSPSALSAPSNTPSTKDTSSSLIDYIPKSPTSSTSLSPNGYLNPPTSPPPRVSPPPPTQENTSMDITLTLSLITPLDIKRNSDMGGIGGGSFAKRSMVAKDGLGGDGFVVDGGRSPSTSSKDGEDGGVENKSSMGSRLIVTGEIVVEWLLEKLVGLPMCSPTVERMVDREEKKFLD